MANLILNNESNEKKISSNFIITLDYKISINGKLKKGLMRLDKRSREVIYKRYLSLRRKSYKLHDLSLIFNISSERIRQIEKSAILKLRSITNLF